VLTSVLSRVALAAVPGAGLVVSVLVVAYVVTQRKIDLRLTID
jgi:Na+/H+-dicarboxylate symporter